MSYVVLARKYRPRRFDEMVGQGHVVQALGNALAQRRLHHAYLFTGTRGIGKTTVSRILAKSLNCLGEDGHGDVTAQPCGVCAACTAIDADRFVDYIELDAASNRSIDEVRDLIERAAYRPAVGRFKVFMIDEAHQLTKDAFNALLKTLEEPPEYLQFVLATTDPEKMLPTVLSRCLQFNLRPMAPELVQEHLAKVLAAENVPCDEGALRLLGRAARGSMRDGLSLTDQAIAYGAGQVTEAAVRAMLGSASNHLAPSLLDALAARDGAALLQCLDAMRGQGSSALAVLEDMAELLQLAAIEQAVPGALDDADERAEAARALAVRMPADEVQLLYSMLVHGQGELALMSDEIAAFTMVLLRLFAFPAVGSGVEAPAARTPRSQPLRAAAPRPAQVAVRPERVAPAAARPAAAEPAPAVRREAGDPALGDRWAALVADLVNRGAITALARELAMQSGLVGIDAQADPPCWRLQVERESLRGAPTLERLAAAMSQALGAEVVLQTETGCPADSPALREAKAREQRQHAAVTAVETDPVVRQMLAQFEGARIVPGSIKPV